MGFSWYVCRLILALTLVFTLGCEDIQPKIDAADVVVNEISVNNGILAVDGSNIGWFKTAQLESDAIPAEIIDLEITGKADDQLILQNNSNLAVSIDFAQKYRLKLDAGLKSPFVTGFLTITNNNVSPAINIDPVGLVINDSNADAVWVSGTCNVNGADVHASLTDPSSNVLSVTSQCDGATWSALFSGTRYALIESLNISVNATMLSSSSSQTTVKDTILPSGTNLWNHPVAFSNVQSLAVSLAGLDANPTDYQYAVVSGGDCTGALSSQTWLPFSVMISDNISAFADGQISICVRTRDVAGNIQTPGNQVTWMKDTVAPGFNSMSVTESTANPGYARRLTGLQVVGSGVFSESSVQLELYETADCSGIIRLNQSVTTNINEVFNLSSATEGVHPLSVILRDAAGNNSGCQATQIMVDTIAPTLSSFQINGGDSISPLRTLPLSFSATDSGSGAENYAIFSQSACGGSAMTAGTLPVSSLTHNLASGTGAVFSAQVFDKAGNSICSSDSPFTFALEVIPKYGTSKHFHHWVRISDSSLECDPSAFSDCQWAGVFRKIETAESDCSGNLTVQEETANDFDWTCVAPPTSGPTAVLYGKLKSTKGVRDMIASTAGVYNWRFKAASLTKDSGTFAGASNSQNTAWWDGNVSTLTAANNGVVTTLSDEGGVYVVPAGMTVQSAGIVFQARKISLIAADGNIASPTAKISSAAGLNSSLIQLGSNASFAWIEVPLEYLESNYSPLIDVNGAHVARIRVYKSRTAGNGILVQGAHAVQIHSSEILYSGATPSGRTGVSITGPANFAQLSNVNVSRFYQGIQLQQINQVLVADVVSSENQGMGIWLSDVSNSRFSVVRAFNNTSTGIYEYNGASNTFQNIVASSNAVHGLQVSNTTNDVFQNTLAARNSGNGFETSSTTGLFISNFSAVNNQGVGFYYSSDSSGAYLNRMAAVSNVSYSYQFDASSVLHSNLLSYTAGAVGMDCFGMNCPSPPMFLAPAQAPQFVISATANGYTNYVDWVSIMRANWLTTIGFAPYGDCSSGVCSAYNWNLSGSDSVFRNQGASTGFTSQTADVFLNEAVCPSYLMETMVGPGGQNYIRSAMEIIHPRSPKYIAAGDHDGRCETGESCIALPNLGVYQGQGSLNRCTGAPLAVTMYGYADNGATGSTTTAAPN